MPRRPLLLETFEDRILCSASVPVDPAVAPQKAAAAVAAPPVAVTAAVPAPTPAAPDPASAAALTPTAGAPAQLTDVQRAAIQSVVRDSTNQIYFEKNAGQYPVGVQYGFRTNFGAMLVYADHLRIISNQTDAATGAVGVQAVDISFTGSAGNWDIVPGGQSAVTGAYQQANGNALQPGIFNELTLRNVYAGVDLRLYSAQNGVLEFDWIVGQAKNAGQIRIAVSGQDGLTFNSDGSATINLRYQNLTLKIPESYQLINGQKQIIGSRMVAGNSPGEIRYELTGKIVADAPLVIDPNVQWATFFDLNDGATPFDSYAFAVAGNANGVYVAGWVREIITNGSFGNYMEVNAGFSQGTAINQNYIYRLSNDGLHITAWTNTGRTNDNSGAVNQKLNGATVDEVVDLELFPDGRVLAAFNSGVLQIYSADLSTRSYNASPVTMDALNSVAIVDNNSFYASGRVAAAIPVAQIPLANIGPDSTYAGGALGLEGVIVRYSGATTTPTPDWATYVGGAGDEYFTTVAMTPDHTKLVFATTTAVTAAGGYSGLVNAVDSTAGAAGTTELLVGVLTDQATKPAAFNVFSFLGGSGNEGTLAGQTVTAMVAASNTGFWVAGNTNSANLPGVTVASGGAANGAQTTFGGGTSDAFISYIPINGSAGTGFQSTYVGGTGVDISGGIAYDPVKDRVFLFGTTTGAFPTQDTTPTSLFYGNTFGGGTYDIFIATYSGNLQTKDYATYLGGSGNDYVGQTGVVLGQGHVYYNPVTDLTYLATTTHSTNWPASEIGTPPGKDTVNENVGNDTHIVFAFNINIFDYGDAPASYEGSPSNPANDAISNTLRIGANVTADAGPKSGVTATGDTADDGIATLPTLIVGDAAYSVVVSVLNNSGSAKTLQGWIDFNGDGTFEAGEYASVSVPTNASQQNVTLTWNAIPAMTAGQSYLRLRLNDGALTDNVATPNIDERSIGLGGTGEVEDYALTIYPLPSNLSGKVYRDLNNDGVVAGAGETGISGVTVTLTGTNDLGAAVNLTATTDASGNYSFLGIRPSNATGYTLTETQPAGFLDGKNTVGTSGGVTVNNPLSDVISGIMLAGNTTATGYDFGELPPTSLAGTVYRDLNNDGIISGAGETGVAAVTVTLTGTDDLGNAVSTTATTNAAGTYSFGNLRPGTYTLTETQPAGLFDGKETAGIGVITPGTVNNTAVSNTISGIVVGGGETGTGNNFGELPPSSLAGVVYRDINNDGVQSGAGETGVAGVTVALTGTDDFGAAVSLSTTTDAAGAYSFVNLRPGSYTITETQPAALLDGKETVGTQASGTIDNTTNSNTISSVALASNVNGTGNDFGELPASSFAGTVFIDTNNDGVQAGASETGISGATVTLTGTDDRGNAVNVSTTSNASGAYVFGTLRPGSYVITETQPVGFLDGKNAVGTAGGTTVNNPPSDIISAITLTANVAATGYNFGELSPSSLAGTVFDDNNNDGILNGADAGIAGVTVTLTGTDDLGVAVSTSTTTSGTGAYSFANVRPGTYTLTETQPAAFLDGKETAGGGVTTPGTVNNAAVSNTISNIVVNSAQTGTGNNFAEVAASALAGTVYQDLNNDGIQLGAGETGISGVTVTLTGTDDFGAAVSTVATTNGTGGYSFATLRPGTYTLTKTQPAAFLDGKETVGTQASGTINNAANSNTISAITLTPNVTGAGNNFGELPPSSFAGTVFIDANNDGVQSGAGETGIGGATLTLTGTDDRGNAVNVSTTTNASGAYAFGTLRPGNYVITETQPAGFLDGKNAVGTAGGTTVNNPPSDIISAITLAANVAATGYNFGELSPTSVSGSVYNDLNNDGIQLGAGETGIAGVTVTLTGTDDLGIAVNTSTTTNASGAYSFANMRPGTYTLTETQPAGLLDGKETAGAGVTTPGTVNNAAVSNTISNLVVASGQTGSGNNFGELPPSSFAGTVFIDANNDGVQAGASETGISNATVTLTGTDDFGAAVNLTTTTNASGAYAFGTLRPGTYVITETQPAGFLDGKNAVGTAGGTTVNNPPSDIISAITLAANVAATGYNFGELAPTSLAGTVFSDSNNDGILNGTDAGIAGVTVTLTGTDDLGNAVSTSTTTNGTGAYSFANVRPGTYTLTEAQPAAFLDGKETAGGGVTTPGTVNNAAVSNTISNIVVASGQTGTGNNFAELPPSSFSGTVYQDLNNDGVQSGAGETGVSGVTITLTGTDNFGAAVNLTTTTDASGAYTFATLRPGTYTLTETQPAGLLDGKETVGSQASGTIDNTTNSNTISTITLAAGVNGAGNNFGELPPTLLAGTIFIDVNNDGVQSGAGETGISGTTVTLTGNDDRGAAVNLTATSNAGGAYSFTNLRPGSYVVTETQPAGFLDGKNAVGSAGGTTVNNPASDIISAVTLTSNTTATGYNFGELAPGSLAGVVFNDVNNDGVQQAGDNAIGGVTVALTGTDDLGNAVTLTATTNGGGAYAFGNLRPGTYTLTETQPAGLLDGKETAGTGTTTAGAVNNTAVSNTISGIVLGSGQAGVANNFAELSPSGFSGAVYRDLNNDGVQFGAGETGVNGVTITLTGTDDFGVAVSLTTTTDASGNYAFATLRPGTYTLTETQPAGLLDGKETVGSQASGTIDNTTNSNTISTITLGTGVNGTGNNFGELPASSFAGTVFIDANNDGVQLGAGETGINGATVTLTGTDDRGNAVNVSTATNASGAYAFGTLRPGTYVITETQPAGFLDGKNAVGTAGGTTVNNPPSDIISSITLAANTGATGYNFGELQGATISGSVYLDANNDGIFQGGETAQPGVTVALTGTDDLGNAVSLTTTTNGAGAYSFTTLRPGTYTITETQPAGLLDGKETAGGGVTTPGTVNNTIDSNTISGIVIASGQTGAANNFGELSPSSLTATAYRDLNNDGVQSGAGETGISGVTVTVTGTDDRGNAVSTALLTDASGNVSFTNLRPGSYTITETQPAGFNDGLDSNGTPAGTLTNDQISSIAVVSGTTGTGYKFGELPTTSISGTVYRDLNNDGLIAGAGETGIGGVTVTLTGTDDLGAAVNVSVTTAAGGSYTFASLRPSSAAGYTITETQPAAFLDGKNTAGSSGGTTVNNPLSDVISAVVLTAGTGATGYNFGELPPSTLSGSAYLDANNDGIFQGGETAQVGVTVTLTGTDDLGNAVSVSTATGAGGAYAFGNLRPGTYTLAETQPAGLLDGRETVGTQASGTVDNTTNSNTISGITLVANVTGTANNFADLRPAALAGAVFSDGNNDGLVNGADTGIGGATVTLTGTDDRGNAVNVSTATNAGGAYSFGTLRPGTYTLSETQPAGFLDGKDTIGTPGGTTANDVFSGIALTEGTNGANNNFAELAPASLAGSVYIDANNDGVRQGAETGLAGVTVTLTGTDDLGNAVSTTATTGATGAYSFGTLRPSNATGYTITETQPPAYGDGTDAIGTQGGTTGNDVLSAIVLNAGVGGTGNTFGERIVADLSITKTDGSATYIPGTAISYTVVVSNSGPSFVNGAVVADTIPANIGGATWTAVYAGTGSSGAASGSGDINTAINLASGGSATFTITGTVLATATGNLVNTATVAAPAGVTDPTPGNNSATDTDTPNPVADLAITKTDGVTSVVPGTATTYTIVVSNTGPSFVTGATVADTLPAALTGVNWTAAYTGTGSSGAASGAGNISTVINLAVGGTATFTVTGTVAATATGTLVNTATVTPPVGTTDPTPGNNSATDTDTLTPTADLSITKTDGSATYIPGTAISYTVVVSNSGPSFVNGAVVADTIPANIGGATWTAVYAGTGSSGAASGSGDINTAINLASGGSATFTITGTVLATATGNLVNTATVAAPAGVTDPTPGNNSATDTDTPNPVADLAITKTDGVTSVVPGTATTYTIVVSNTGPSFVTGATVADTLPAALTGVNWTAAYTGTGSSGAASGAGNISTVINLAVGGTATFTVTGTVAATATGTLVNTATVTPPVGVTDPTPGNNSATDTDTLVPTADLSITKTDGSATYTPGTAITYTVVVGNTGPSFVNGAVVADTIPANISGAAWTAVYAGAGSAGAAGGSGDINTAINLASGGSATFTISGTVLATATGNLVNTATVAAPAGVTDPNAGNNSATDTDTPNPVADLAITKTDGVTSVVPGTATTYTIVVSNTGPSFVTGATVADTLPAALTGVNWTAAYTGTGSSGAASGAGNISTVINLAVGGTATFTVTGTVAATATGTLVNTATVTPPVGVTDPTPGNNSATDTDTLVPTADLSITKTDGSATYIPGTAITYTVVVGNTGPSFVTGAVVADTIPANIGGATWTAVYAGTGSSGAASGSGDINTAINLASGGSATFTITGTVLATATGNLVNTATVAAPAGVTDPTPGNNSATDTDTPNPVADLAITKTDGVTSVVPGTATTYTIVVSNTGPSFVTGATVADTLPAALTGVNWTAAYTGTGSSGAASGAGNISTVINLAVGGTATFTVTGTVAATATGTLVNTATVTPPVGTTDPTPGNNSATDTDTLVPTADLSITKTDGSATYIPGTAISYTVVVSNTGPSFVNGAVVADTIPANIGGATWTAVYAGAGSGGAASGSGDISTAINLASGGSATFTVTGTVLLTATGNLVNTATVTQPAGVTDPTPGNNSATDTDTRNTTSLAGFVFNDANNDGIRQAGESGIAGATLTLTGTDNLGAAVNVTVATLADGSYSFINLRPSNAAGYTITETQPVGFLDGTDTIGTPGGTAGNDVFSAIVLADGVSGANNNFGELRPATLSGTVFQDNSNDGTQQAGEPGVANVAVTLTGTDDRGNAVNVTANTLADGSYSFGNLRPGTYAITETQPAALLDGKDALGTAGGTLANDQASAITLAEGQTGGGYTFGELAASSFSGTVFSDLNNNGAIDPGETGIRGAAVTLTGTDDLGNAVSLSTASAADGTYSFGTLRPGSYVITETQPAGFLDGQNTAGTAGGTTVNNPPSDVISAIALPSNTGATGYLFGELTPASFSGTVFHDLNNNGAIDPGEPGIAGATVTLTGTNDLGNAVSVSAVSAADGGYTFANLRPGTYTLTETQPAGYLDGTDTVGTAGGTPTNDTFSAIALAVGQTGGGYLFGELTAPDLVVTKTDGTATAKPGDLLTYTITVANASLQQAASVTVTDQFPSALQFVSASNGGTLDPLTGVITWNVGAIAGANAQTITLTVVARVPATLPHGVSSVTNTVTATDVSGVDANPANNTAGDTDSIPASADLYVFKTDNLKTAQVGQQTTYTITGGNAGEQTAEGVVVSDALPPGLRFVSASNGGQLAGGRVVWNLGDLAPGATFQLTVRTVVESATSGKNVLNTVTIADRFGSPDDVTPFNNSATDATRIEIAAVFAFDTFHNFASHGPRAGLLPGLSPIDVSREALLPLAPVYSGEADPGSTLVVSLYNAKGEQIGSQTVMVDAGGNWLTTFTSSVMRDTPSSVRISLLPAPASYGDSFGHNLRAYFSPALNPGHFFETIRDLGFDRSSAPLLDGLGLENPLQLGSVKYGGELLSTQGTASGE